MYKNSRRTFSILSTMTHPYTSRKSRLIFEIRWREMRIVKSSTIITKNANLKFANDIQNIISLHRMKFQELLFISNFYLGYTHEDTHEWGLR